MEKEPALVAKVAGRGQSWCSGELPHSASAIHDYVTLLIDYVTCVYTAEFYVRTVTDKKFFFNNMKLRISLTLYIKCGIKGCWRRNSKHI